MGSLVWQSHMTSSIGPACRPSKRPRTLANSEVPQLLLAKRDRLSPLLYRQAPSGTWAAAPLLERNPLSRWDTHAPDRSSWPQHLSCWLTKSAPHYAARLVDDPWLGLHLLAWRRWDQHGRFAGELIDPLPVDLTDEVG